MWKAKGLNRFMDFWEHCTHIAFLNMHTFQQSPCARFQFLFCNFSSNLELSVSDGTWWKDRVLESTKKKVRFLELFFKKEKKIHIIIDRISVNTVRGISVGCFRKKWTCFQRPDRSLERKRKSWGIKIGMQLPLSLLKT